MLVLLSRALGLLIDTAKEEAQAACRRLLTAPPSPSYSPVSASTYGLQKLDLGKLFTAKAAYAHTPVTKLFHALGDHSSADSDTILNGIFRAVQLLLPWDENNHLPIMGRDILSYDILDREKAQQNGGSVFWFSYLISAFVLLPLQKLLSVRDHDEEDANSLSSSKARLASRQVRSNCK